MKEYPKKAKKLLKKRKKIEPSISLIKKKIKETFEEIEKVKKKFNDLYENHHIAVEGDLNYLRSEKFSNILEMKEILEKFDDDVKFYRERGLSELGKCIDDTKEKIDAVKSWIEDLNKKLEELSIESMKHFETDKTNF